MGMSVSIHTWNLLTYEIESARISIFLFSFILFHHAICFAILTILKMTSATAAESQCGSLEGSAPNSVLCSSFKGCQSQQSLQKRRRILFGISLPLQRQIS